MCGNLQIQRFALDQFDRCARSLDDRCVIGKIRIVGPLVCPAQKIGAEYLRRLYDSQNRTVERMRSYRVSTESTFWRTT